MSIIAVGGLRGSPGASTLALDLATGSPEQLLIEADPDGGVLAARQFLGLKPGLVDLAGAARTGIEPENIWKFAQHGAGGCAVIVGHPAAEQIQGALRAATDHIGAALRALDANVVLDIGRIRPGSPALALAAYADHLVVLIEPTLESVVTLSNRATVLQGFPSVHIVLSSNNPYSVAEVSAAAHRQVWGVVPHAAGRRTTSMRRVRLARLTQDLVGRDVEPALDFERTESGANEFAMVQR